MLRFIRSFRVRLFLVIGLVAGAPIGLIGLWITNSVSRASEELLRPRVAEVLQQTAADIRSRWIQERSAVLDLADSPLMRQAVRNGTMEPAAALLTRTVTVRDSGGKTIDSYVDDAFRLSEPSIPLVVPIHTSPLGPRIGSLEAPVHVGKLLQARRINPGGVAIMVGVFDGETSAPLIPLPFEWTGQRSGTLEWSGDRWLVQTYSLAEPRLDLVAAAPLTPFEEPLRSVTRSGLWFLFAVSAIGMFLASMLIFRMTQTLDRLTDAAEAVSGGALDRQVAEGGGTEFDRMARAFNRMTVNLRSSLQELAEQRALARIGEFAASLAHEIRNPLTAIRVDLQVVEEAIAAQPGPVRPLRRALTEVDRLNTAVGNVLTATRIARKDLSPVDLRIPLEAAIAAARKTAPRPVSIPLEIRSPEPLWVAGDQSAMEQIFLNLLLNAVDAVRDGGEIHVAAERDGNKVCVHVIDTGSGLTPEAAVHAFEPFFTTREHGTGLGLSIAARLARAHGGSIELEPAPGVGTAARIRLPFCEV